jgi:hypothetical protein
MAEMNKITSFKTFTQLRAEESAAKLAEEKQAKKAAIATKLASMLDEMDIENIEKLEDLEEGNAFIYAAAKAKQEGKDEFEFNGKKYKVTLKADTGLRESEEIVNESYSEREITDQEPSKEAEKLRKSVGGKAYWSRKEEVTDAGEYIIRYEMIKDGDAPYGLIILYYPPKQNEPYTSSKNGEFAIERWSDGTELYYGEDYKKAEAAIKKHAKSYVEESVVNEAKKLDKKGTLAIAQKIADIFTQESAADKEYIKYTVNPSVEPMHFDLDAEPTTKTPKKIANDPNYFGEYAGGSLYIKDNGEEFVVYNAAMGSAEIESFTYDGKLIESVVNEAIVVTGKRAAKTVMNTYIKFFEKFPALGRNAMGVPVIHHMGAVKELYVEAMTDANFSREIPATKSAMKGRVFPVNIKAAELGNTTITVSAGKLMDICATHGSAISGAAKFSGMAIVEGTAMYLDSIGKTKEAEDLMAKFNKAMANESNDVRVDVEAKLNEAAALNEGEKEEQTAMELYTQVAGPDGAYSEVELQKAGMDKYMEIVTAAGHKGSKAKKIADEFRKIATMESNEVVEEKSETLSDYEEALATAKKYGVPVAMTMATVASVGIAGTIALFKKGKRAYQQWADSNLEESFANLLTKETTEESAVTEAKKFYSTKEIAKMSNAAGDIVVDAKHAIQDLGVEYGDKVPAKELDRVLAEYDLELKDVMESVVTEAEVQSTEEFTEYAMKVLKQAFGDDFDEAKAQEVIDGLTSKYGEDYGAMVGALQSSLA